MSLSNSLALFGTMFVLAIIPSPSVFAVVARSVASGFIHGAITALGIILGDSIFIVLAMLGLWSMAETNVFFLVRYLGSAYLIYLGIVTWQTQPRQQKIEATSEFCWLSNFMAGLLITLSDPKAILFYAGFLPAYLDVSSLSVTQTGSILLIATVAVGGAKVVYAYLADKARFLFRNSQFQTVINGLAAIAMVATGFFLAVKA